MNMMKGKHWLSIAMLQTERALTSLYTCEVLAARSHANSKVDALYKGYHDHLAA